MSTVAELEADQNTRQLKVSGVRAFRGGPFPLENVTLERVHPQHKLFPHVSQGRYAAYHASKAWSLPQPERGKRDILEALHFLRTTTLDFSTCISVTFRVTCPI